ncbi:MAG: APC family permease [Acidobacteria bacterium]|nr:APC family permease [Acidobacteriota bacterium]
MLGQFLVVVGTNWLGTAALLGPGHAMYWALGLALFHIPLAAVVIRLTREVPVEGGIYAWAKVAFGETAGFLAAWNMWVFIATFTSTLGLAAAQGLSYGAGALGLTLQPPPALLHVALIGFLVLVASSGLGLGRILHDAGALLLAVLLTLLVGFAVLAGPAPAAAGGVGETSLLVQATVFAKITVFGLAGLECLSTLAGETRNPGRALPRSVLFAVPLIAGFYLLGTEAVRRLAGATAIDLVNPVAQAFSLRGGSLLAAGAIGVLLVRDVAQASISFTALTRLPLVAGWDRLLPAWFTRLSESTGVPVRSIFVAGGLAIALGLLGSLDAGTAEAFQLLQSAAGLFFGATYLVLFAIPLLARPGFTRPPLWLRAASASGFLVTLLFLALAVVPIVEVPDAGRFALRVLGVFVVAEGIGLALLALGRRAGGAKATPVASATPVAHATPVTDAARRKD